MTSRNQKPYTVRSDRFQVICAHCTCMHRAHTYSEKKVKRNKSKGFIERAQCASIYGIKYGENVCWLQFICIPFDYTLSWMLLLLSSVFLYLNGCWKRARRRLKSYVCVGKCFSSPTSSYVHVCVCHAQVKVTRNIRNGYQPHDIHWFWLNVSIFAIENEIWLRIERTWQMKAKKNMSNEREVQWETQSFNHYMLWRAEYLQNSKHFFLFP